MYSIWWGQRRLRYGAQIIQIDAFLTEIRHFLHNDTPDMQGFFLVVFVSIIQGIQDVMIFVILLVFV